jgi:uncharacterized protein (DUF58 family)
VDDRSQVPFLESEVLARLAHQFLHARVPMVGNVTGHHKSPHRGSSVEFAEYRKYTPGDDIRRLDWRVFGRTDRFYIREFEADTNLRCYCILDCSASMGFGPAGKTKLDYAQRLVASLAYLTVQQGDAVGLQCYADQVLHDVPPRRNPAHLRNIFDTLAKAVPAGETALVRMLHDFAEKVKSRALVILFSDCFCDVGPLLDAFQHLRFRKHDLAVFHLLDPQEVEFKFDRPIRFLDMELADSLLAEPAVIRSQYLGALDEYLTRLREGCNRFHADYRQVLTNQDYEKVLANFLVEREQLVK